MIQVKGFKTNDKGFTYLSLIIGITILLIGLGFFSRLFTTSRTSIAIAKERMAMATVAQNMGQVYMATYDIGTAVTQGSNQGYTVDLTPDPVAGKPGIMQITIGVNPKYPSGDPKNVERYILVFYVPEKPST